jgi:crotonobetainyl-CoA:carnitine CoA-transferase CaiB-like acyl-CoA transferase
LHVLLRGADVVVCGYRPGALDRFGISATELVERHPGLVVVVLDAWGHTGPWSGRRGFDSVVQAPTGIAAGESRDGLEPGALPCQLLDHGTGYLAAAAALDGLRRQMLGGGTDVRRLSLARTAAWLTTSPLGPPPPDASAGEDADPWLDTVEAEDGPVVAVRPPGTIGDHPLAWPPALARYGRDAPEWQT